MAGRVRQPWEEVGLKMKDIGTVESILAEKQQNQTHIFETTSAAS